MVFYYVAHKLGINQLIPPTPPPIPIPPILQPMLIPPTVQPIPSPALLAKWEFWEMEKTLSNNLEKKISEMQNQGLVDNGTMEPHDKVIYVYNPLIYASEPHCNYLKQYCGQKDVLFVGMNPGRNGMGQNGVPFGDPDHVRNWLKITGTVTEVVPPNQNKEESGHRFWELMKDIYISPESFSQKCFVYNYCPLLFVDNKDNNIPLNGIPANSRRNIEDVCDWALSQCIRIIMPKAIVAVGGYAEGKIMQVQNQNGTNIHCAKIRHPVARGLMSAEEWKGFAKVQLRERDIL